MHCAVPGPRVSGLVRGAWAAAWLRNQTSDGRVPQARAFDLLGAGLDLRPGLRIEQSDLRHVLANKCFHLYFPMCTFLLCFHVFPIAMFEPQSLEINFHGYSPSSPS